MKKNKGKGLFFIILSFVLMFSSVAVFADAPQEPTTITIYHTNDIHGAFSSSSGSIGIDKVAALKDATANSILVDAGDATQGLPLVTLSKGEDAIEIMNVAGYDLMAAGNHEFDYGSDVFIRNADLADFPILAANVYGKTSGEAFLENHPVGNNGCHTIIERNGIKIGFFGLVTTATKTSTNPAGITDVDFRDEIAAAKTEIDELEQEGADVIIAVAHLGEYTIVPVSSTQLAEAMTGDYAGKLDAIIDGHSHTVEVDKLVNGVYIQQTGSSLVNLGKLDVTIYPDGSLDLAGAILPADQIMVTPKEEVTAKVKEIEDSLADILKQPIGELTTSLWGGTIGDIPIARVTETNLGDFMADAYKEAATDFIQEAEGMSSYQGLPIVAVENGGGIRATLGNGQVTQGDLVTVLPFSNTLMIKEVTPQILYQAMENSVSGITGQDATTGKLDGSARGAFLQMSGMRIAYDPAQAAGSKVVSISLTGSDTALDKNDSTTKIMMIANNFVMNGGSGYSMLASLLLVGEIGGELETVQNYLLEQTQNGTVPLAYSSGDARIIVQSTYTAETYEATLTITETKEDGSSAPVANKEVPIYIDGSATPVKVTTDANGNAKITLQNGGHGLRTSTTEKEVYADNATGFGLEGATLTLNYQVPAEEPVPVPDPEPDPEPEPNPDPETPKDPIPPVITPVITETPTPTSTKDENKGNTGASVQTGDEAPIILYVLLMFGAVGALVWRKQRMKG